MSDYLTRLIERSLDLPPQIEPLIAPIHSPSGQMLSETLETSATIESGPVAKPLVAPIHTPRGLVLSETVESPAVFELGSVAKVGTSQREAPPGVALNAMAAEPAFSQIGSQPARPSTPLPELQAEFPVEKKDDWPDPIESRPKVRSRRTFSPSRPEPVEITGASLRASPPLYRATPIVSKGKNQVVVPLEAIKHAKPATTPAGSLPQPSLKKPSAIRVSRPASPVSGPETSPSPAGPVPVSTGLVSKEKSQIVLQPKIISSLKPATVPAVSLLHPSPKEPPAIHVTIGRVEVRAMMPAAQVKPPPERSAPKMSLDDYLRSRNGGQR